MTSTATATLRDDALRYLSGGLSLVPCSHKTKRPDARLLPLDDNGKPVWKPYQETPADESSVCEWFAAGCKSVAAIGGKVSGGLLVLDFDVEGFYERWLERVGNLADRLPVQRTGGGCYQVWLRCPEPGKNTELAWAPNEEKDTGREVAIETRAEGGYAVMPGSLHPLGTTYETLTGDFAKLPAVSQAHADALLDAARKLDEAPFTRQEMERQRKAAKESTKHRSQVNGEVSVIDAYNQAVTIEVALEAYRYTRSGDRWRRPDGKTESVYVQEGRSFHHSTNDPLHDGYWHRAFDLFAFHEHNGDCREAVKAAAELLGMKGERQREHDGNEAPHEAEQQTPPKPRFTCYSLAELSAMDLSVDYVFRNALIAGSPGIIGGREKTLKTQITLDCAISMATFTPWLDHFEPVRAARSVYFAGEGGLVFIRESARRIAERKGFALDGIVGLFVCDQVPNLTSGDDMRAVAEVLQDHEAEFAFFDPLYLMMADQASNASNVYAMGAMLRRMLDACRDAGATPIVCHHFRKCQPIGQPPDLSDLSQAGCAEFAGQWLLINRQVPYDEEQPGEHDLIVRLGSRLGFSSKWALHASEGTPEGGRYWHPEVSTASEARERDQGTKAAARAAAAREKQERDMDDARRAIVQVMTKLSRPGERSEIRDRTPGKTSHFGPAWASLLDDDIIVHVGHVKKGNGRSYPTFKLADTQDD